MSRSTRPEMPAGDNRHSAGTWLLLRGLTREAGHWGRFPQQLQAALPGARILAIDLPGNGTLHRHPSPTSIPEMVTACRGELAAHGVTGPVHVVAMSLGAKRAILPARMPRTSGSSSWARSRSAWTGVALLAAMVRRTSESGSPARK